MGNSEIEKICKQIYKKHKDALDLIFEFKPDIQSDISDYLQSLIKSEPSLILDSYGKSVIRFTSENIDKVMPKISEGWTKSNRLILFEFNNYADRLALRFYLGPGDIEKRQSLYNFFSEKGDLFTLTKQGLYKKWNCLYQHDFLKKKDYEDKEYPELIEKIDKKWAEFKSGELVEIELYISKWTP